MKHAALFLFAALVSGCTGRIILPETAPQVAEIFHDRAEISWDNAGISNRKGRTVFRYQVHVSHSPGVHEILLQASGRELNSDEASALSGDIDADKDFKSYFAADAQPGRKSRTVIENLEPDTVYYISINVDPYKRTNFFTKEGVYEYRLYPLLELKTLPKAEGERRLLASQKPLAENVHVEKSDVIAAKWSSWGREYGILEELKYPYVDIAPAGWSSDGKFAYRSRWMVNDDAYGYTLTVFDAVTDTVVEENQMSLRSPGGYEYAPARDKNTVLSAWNALLAKHRITGTIANPVAEITAPLNQFPFAQYDAWFDYELIYDRLPEYNYRDETIKWRLLAGNGRGQKTISSGVEDTDLVYGMKIVGFFQSPHEDRIVILVARFSSDRKDRGIRLYGCHLGLGF